VEFGQVPGAALTRCSFGGLYSGCPRCYAFCGPVARAGNPKLHSAKQILRFHRLAVHHLNSGRDEWIYVAVSAAARILNTCQPAGRIEEFFQVLAKFENLPTRREAISKTYFLR
jgi:hypothetical protein